MAYLLEEGADVNIANQIVATAAMLVQKFGRESMVKYAQGVQLHTFNI